MNIQHWISITERMPESGRVVTVLTPGGDVRPLKYGDNLWWLPDGSMYVYFTPTHWTEG